MFVSVPKDDADSNALIEKAVELLHESLWTHEYVLLVIYQVEGVAELHPYFAPGVALNEKQGLEADAEMHATVVAVGDKRLFGTEDKTYYCTMVEYYPKTRTHARIFSGVLNPPSKKPN